MKIVYSEKEKNEFSPFMLLLEFDTKKDLNTFYEVLNNALWRIENNEGKAVTNEKIDLINQIHDAITLKKSK